MSKCTCGAGTAFSQSEEGHHVGSCPLRRCSGCGESGIEHFDPNLCDLHRFRTALLECHTVMAAFCHPPRDDDGRARFDAALTRAGDALGVER